MCVWYKTFKICENATKCRLWQIDAANLSFSWLIAISWNVFMLFIEIIFKFLNMILCSKEWKCIINESSVNNWLQWLSFLQGWNTPLTDRTPPPPFWVPPGESKLPLFLRLRISLSLLFILSGSNSGFTSDTCFD